MAHANGKNQKRDQDRIGVKLKIQRRQQPEQPDHRHDRACNHQQGAAYAARVPIEDDRANNDRDGKEHQYLLQTGKQITHHLGEASHVNLDVVRLVLFTEFFDPPGEIVVINTRPGLNNLFLQRHQDDAGLEVCRHQLANLTGPLNIEAHLINAGR